MLLFLLLLSIAVGVILFVKLLGPDAWLIKGLMEDKIGAIVGICLVVVSAILLSILLRFFLLNIPVLLAASSVGPDKDSIREYAQQTYAWDIVVRLLILCIPIVTAYLLYQLYRATNWVIRKFVLLFLRPKSW